MEKPLVLSLLLLLFLIRKNDGMNLIICIFFKMKSCYLIPFMIYFLEFLYILASGGVAG